MLDRHEHGIAGEPCFARSLHHALTDAMLDHQVTVDRSTTPSGIEIAPLFNLCVPFVDRHILEGRADKVVARGRTWQMTFGELHDAVQRMGNVYRSLGVASGDRV